MKIRDFSKTQKGKLAFTLFLVLCEAALMLLFPLFMGYAIGDALEQKWRGIFLLGGLGVALILLGGGRRFYDSRFYGALYTEFAAKMLEKSKDSKTSSQKSARMNMLREIVEFMENSFPMLIVNVLGLFGTIIIIAYLNLTIFYMTMGVIAFVGILYMFTSKYTTFLNKGYNDEFEKQVQVIETKDSGKISNHLKKFMRWNIRLSDLETVNFSLSWIFMIAYLLLCVVIAARSGIGYGALFALITYVFQLMENIESLPLYYQQWLRLKEIQDRLDEV